MHRRTVGCLGGCAAQNRSSDSAVPLGTGTQHHGSTQPGHSAHTGLAQAPLPCKPPGVPTS